MKTEKEKNDDAIVVGNPARPMQPK